MRARRPAVVVAWAILAAVAGVWAALVAWTTADVCCDLPGKPAIAVAFWFVSLAAVPAAAWLLAEVHRREPTEGESLRSDMAALAARILILFSAGVLALAAFAAVNVINHVGHLVFEDDTYWFPYLRDQREFAAAYSGVAFAWCLLVGLSTLIAARRLDRAVRAESSSAWVWVIAACVAFVAVVATSAGWAAVTPTLNAQHIFEADNALHAEELDDDQISERPDPPAPSPTPSPEPATSSPSPPPPAEPEPRPIKLPVTLDDASSGYRLFPRIEITGRYRGSFGYRYTVYLSGVWTADGPVEEQKCRYAFFGEDGDLVYADIQPFGFFEGRGERFRRRNTITVIRPRMDADPERAQIACRDHKGG